MTFLFHQNIKFRNFCVAWFFSFLFSDEVKFTRNIDIAYVLHCHYGLLIQTKSLKTWENGKKRRPLECKPTEKKLLFWEDITYKYSIRSSINIVWVGRNRWRLNCVYSVCSWLLLSSYDHTFFCVLRNSRGISPGTSTPEMLPGAEQVPRCSYILKLILWIKMSYYDSLIPHFMRLLNLF